jgi:hypothetical protein
MHRMSVIRIPRKQLAQRRRARHEARAREAEERLHWLIAFARTPIATLTSSEREAVAKEVRAFAAFRVHGVVTETESVLPAPADLTVRAVIALQSELGSMLNTLWPPNPAIPSVAFRLKAPSTGMFVARTTGTDQVQAVTTAVWPSTFWWVAVSLLQAHGTRIRRCMARTGATTCGRLFVRTRRQIFCSPACSRRERARQWYETHQTDERERRRAAYARRTLKRGQP